MPNSIPTTYPNRTGQDPATLAGEKASQINREGLLHPARRRARPRGQSPPLYHLSFPLSIPSAKISTAPPKPIASLGTGVTKPNDKPVLPVRSDGFGRFPVRCNTFSRFPVRINTFSRFRRPLTSRKQSRRSAISRTAAYARSILVTETLRYCPTMAHHSVKAQGLEPVVRWGI